MTILNRKKLSEEFDMDFEENNEITDLVPKVTDKSVLESNIDRANRILDLIEGELNDGNFEARLIEVAGQLINSVTNAQKEIISDINYNEY
jgi:hypothetical protein